MAINLAQEHTLGLLLGSVSEKGQGDALVEPAPLLARPVSLFKERARRGLRPGPPAG